MKKVLVIIAMVMFIVNVSAQDTNSKADAFRRSAPAFSGNHSEKMINPVEAKEELSKNASRKEIVISKNAVQEVSTISLLNTSGEVLKTKTSIISKEIRGFYVYAGAGVSSTKTINPLGIVGVGYEFPRLTTGVNFSFAKGNAGLKYSYEGLNMDADLMLKLLSNKSQFQASIGLVGGFVQISNESSAKLTLIQDDQIVAEEEIPQYLEGYNLKGGFKAAVDVRFSNRITSKAYDWSFGAFAQYDMFSIQQGKVENPTALSTNAISCGFKLTYKLGRKLY